MSMFSGLHSTHILHGTCKNMNHFLWHKYGGSHVPGHMYPNLKRDTSTSNTSGQASIKAEVDNFYKTNF